MLTTFPRRAVIAMGLIAGLALGPVALADAPEHIDGATTVDANGAIDLITSTSGLVIFDNRREGDFAAGHIEGAIRLIDTDISGPDVLAAHGAEPDTPVLFYCNGLSCGHAANAAGLAVDWGYDSVFYYALGMVEWNALGLPVVTQ